MRLRTFCETEKMPEKRGRPRLEDREGFPTQFTLVAKLRAANQISQRQAAKQLGISVRSFKRYYQQGSGQ